jgi:hypothetical protein
MPRKSSAPIAPFVPVSYTHAEWLAEGERRFGPDFMNWRFVCPVCGNVATIIDFKPFADKGATPSSATSECIGRYTAGREAISGQNSKTRPCDYAGYGLFRLSPIRIIEADGKEIHSFAFDEPKLQSANAGEALPANDSPEEHENKT